MKKITTLSISALASAMLLVTGCNASNGNKESASKSVSVTEKSPANEKVGYSLGYMMAEGNKEAVGDLNLDTFEKGFRDGYEGKDSAENGKKEGVKTTASGLQYKVLTAGTGKSPKATDVVEVNYEGKLLDGTVFDSSYERGEPIEFPLNQVIAGWTEGLQLMKEGGKYEFYIPSDIAYGEAGNAGIEPNSTLIFTVELLKVKDNKKALIIYEGLFMRGS